MSGPHVAAAGMEAGYVPGKPVIAAIDFSAGPGQIVAVLGPNGGGKTTLFRTLLGEIAPSAGSCAIEGSAAYVPQSDTSRHDLPVSAYGVALMGAYARTPWHRRIARADRELAHEALRRVGLAEMADEPFGSLSGGQRQRVLIARALVQEAPVLLLDEPFSGVDRVSADAIGTVLRALRDEGRTLLIATHDIEQARTFDRVLCINARQIAFGPPAGVLDAATLEATYGGEIVVLEGGRRAIAVGHHDHDHGHDHG